MKIIRFDQLEPLKGIRYSRVHIDRLEKAAKFPKRVRLGANCVGWVEAEVDQWLEQRAAERK